MNLDSSNGLSLFYVASLMRLMTQQSFSWDYSVHTKILKVNITDPNDIIIIR
jgi:hypothetical protein